jgi:PAS domain S-box-containing protein
MMGYVSEAEVIGKNYLELTTPEARHKLKRTYDHQFINKIKNTYYEFPAVTTDGQIIWVGQNVQLIMDGENITGFQALARDITQLKQTQEAMLVSRDQALDASRTKSQMLSRVSHELRTPLGGILGYTELLQQKAFGELTEKQEKALTHIVESTHFLTQMVNDLLDEAQIEAKSLSLNNRYFSPNTLMNKVSISISALVKKKKGLIFHSEISPEMPAELYGDINRLQQVLVNLASNAIKFTKVGEVQISFKRPSPTQWSIEVSDTGVGIPQGEFETIFQPFHQVNNSITRENRGSGLGLAITKQLIELMDGQIVVQSTLGEGSTFTVTLPITNAPGE